MPPRQLRQLRQRPDVGSQLARANPFILAGLIQRLNKHGVTRIVHATASARGSEIEMAAQIRNRHLVMLVAYAPGSLLARVVDQLAARFSTC